VYLENKTEKLKKTNADQQRQIDNLKRELEEMKQKGEKT
jgi:predicted RNase H-like nuclease (RuvC/YqgF family)